MKREQISKLKKERYEAMVEGEKAIKSKKLELRMYISKMLEVQRGESDPCLRSLGINHYREIIANVQRSLQSARRKQHTLVLAYCFASGKRYSTVEKPGKNYSQHFLDMFNARLNFHHSHHAVSVWLKTSLNIFEIMPNHELLWKQVCLKEEADKIASNLKKSKMEIAEMAKEREYFDTQEYVDKCIKDAIAKELEAIERRKANKEALQKKGEKHLELLKRKYASICSDVAYVEARLKSDVIPDLSEILRNRYENRFFAFMANGLMYDHYSIFEHKGKVFVMSTANNFLPSFPKREANREEAYWYAKTLAVLAYRTGSCSYPECMKIIAEYEGDND